MAAYREHLTTSCVLGIGVCSAAIAMGFTPVQGVLAGTITGIGGILPDLDSESGRPVREVFGVTAGLAPVVMLRRLQEWGGNTDGTMLLAVMLYVTVRYGGATLLGVLACHRGMYHSIPAMLIAGDLAFLGYKSDQIAMKVLMGVGIMLGFLSHLILDELYSVEWRGVKLRLNKFSGSAVKLTGKSWPANIFTYGLLFFLTYAVWVEGGLEAHLAEAGFKIPKRESSSQSTPVKPVPDAQQNKSPMRSPVKKAPDNPQPKPPRSQKTDPPQPLHMTGKSTAKPRPTGRLAEQDDDLQSDPFQ